MEIRLVSILESDRQLATCKGDPQLAWGRCAMFSKRMKYLAILVPRLSRFEERARCCIMRWSSHEEVIQGSIYSETLLRAAFISRLFDLHSHNCMRKLPYMGWFDCKLYFELTTYYFRTLQFSKQIESVKKWSAPGNIAVKGPHICTCGLFFPENSQASVVKSQAFSKSLREEARETKLPCAQGSIYGPRETVLYANRAYCTPVPDIFWHNSQELDENIALCELKADGKRSLLQRRMTICLPLLRYPQALLAFN
jgi:hypothetical protein